MLLGVIVGIVIDFVSIICFAAVLYSDFNCEDFFIQAEEKHKQIYDEEIEINGYFEYYDYLKKEASKNGICKRNYFWKALKDFWKGKKQKKHKPKD